jgi:hypothetical protein
MHLYFEWFLCGIFIANRGLLLCSSGNIFQNFRKVTESEKNVFVAFVCLCYSIRNKYKYWIVLWSSKNEYLFPRPSGRHIYGANCGEKLLVNLTYTLSSFNVVGRSSSVLDADWLQDHISKVCKFDSETFWKVLCNFWNEKLSFTMF